MSDTPNVTIENPRTRKRVRTAIDIIGGLVFIVAAVDVAAPAIDLAAFTLPALAGYTAARVVFGFSVDNPNTPV
ncbi:membrane protein [Microbacterium phage Curie]